MTGELTDQELRAMVRASIARVAAAGGLPGVADAGPVAGVSTSGVAPMNNVSDVRDASHVSHLLLPLLRGADGDGMCLIEPTVRCNRCSYCVSYGH
jgi:hypothetical protein